MKKEFGFVLAAAILLAGCGQKKETTTTTARPVKTTIVESRSIIRKDFSGIVEAVEYVKLGFPGQRTNHSASCHRRTESEKRTTHRSYRPQRPLRCNMPPRNRHTKRLRHKWNVTNGSSPGKRSPYRNMKSASPTSRRRSLNTNCLPTICCDTKLTAPFDGSIENDWWKTISVSTPVRVSCSLSNTHNLRTNSPFRMRIFICCAPKTRVSL